MAVTAPPDMHDAARRPLACVHLPCAQYGPQRLASEPPFVALCCIHCSRSRAQEELEVVGGVFDGQVLDRKGVEAVTKLPTKQELMGQTAIMLKALPTKLARTLHEAGAGRLARATKQASGQKLVQAVKAMEGKK